MVGESGSGKTTLGRTLLRLYEPTAGDVILHEGDQVMHVPQLNDQDMHTFRRNAQMIFQDPYSSLNPRMNILQTVGEPLLVNDVAKGTELEERVEKVMLQVGLRVEHLRRFPHSFSGGQRQRIGIARALVVNPKLVVADEPVSALDVSIQAQILNLLKDLQAQYQLTYLFISHAMSVVRYMSDRIAVMYAGKLVEVAPKEEVLRQASAPLHRSAALGRSQAVAETQAPCLQRRGAGPRQASERLRIPSALQICDGYLQNRGAASA